MYQCHHGMLDRLVAASERVAPMLQVTIEEKSKAVVVRLADQAAVTNQALLAAMNELDSPASLVRRDIHKLPPPP
jgi:hypothetical protein